MGLTASASSVSGTLRQQVVVDGKHELWTDEPVHLGGEGTGPAPHELIPAALASCVGTTLARYAITKGWDLGDIFVDVDFDHRAEPRRFDVTITLSADLTEEQLVRLEKVAAACPVRRSLEAGSIFEERIERHPWREPVGALQP